MKRNQNNVVIVVVMFILFGIVSDSLDCLKIAHIFIEFRKTERKKEKESIHHNKNIFLEETFIS